MKAWLSFFLLFLAPLPNRGQTSSPPAPEPGKRPPAISWANLPVQSIDFATTVPLHGVPDSPAIVAPLRCSPGGTPFLELLLPPTFTTRALVSVGKSGKTTTWASGNSVFGLDDVSQLNYFPADKHVYYLVEARKHDLTAALLGSQASLPPKHFYLLTYGDDARLESTTPLNGPDDPQTIAAFPSGSLAAIELNPIEHDLQLMVMDSHGQNAHPVDIDAGRLYQPDRLRTFYGDVPGSDPSGTGMSKVAAAAQLVPFAQNLLLVQTGTTYPIVEFGDSGMVIRSVRLRLPKGVLIDGFLQSSEPFWLAKVTDTTQNPSTHFLVAIDPDTGEALRRMTTGATTLDSVACDADGVFIALRKEFKSKDDAGTWNLLSSSP